MTGFLGFTICGQEFYGHMSAGVIDPSTADFSVPRTCTLPTGHAGHHLSDPHIAEISAWQDSPPRPAV